MSKNNLKKGVALVMIFMMVFGNITVLADGRVEGEKVISGDTKVMGSAFICDAGFWQNSGNGSGIVVGEDKEATDVYVTIYFEDTSFVKRLGYSTNMFSYIKSYTGYYDYVKTNMGVDRDRDSYLSIRVDD